MTFTDAAAQSKTFYRAWRDLVDSVGEPVAEAWGATPTGNWHSEEAGDTNVLWRPLPLDAVAARHGIAPEELAEQMESGRTALFDERERRVHPATDDKVLTAWNALAIRAFAIAGRALGEPAFVGTALRSAAFVWEHLRGPDGRLLRSWREGKATTLAFADDHALLAGAFLTLYETTADVTWFTRARELGDVLVERFSDPERGGFFQTATDAERLVLRPKDLEDNAVPSGNSAAADLLQRLALFTGDAAYERAGVSALRLVREAMAGAPSGFGHALCALDLYLGPSREVAVIGEPDDPATRALVHEVVRERFFPNVVLAVADPAGEHPAAGVELLTDRPQTDGKPTAYVCERFACTAPVTDPAALAEQLTADRIRGGHPET